MSKQVIIKKDNQQMIVSEKAYQAVYLDKGFSLVGHVEEKQVITPGMPEQTQKIVHQAAIRTTATRTVPTQGHVRSNDVADEVSAEQIAQNLGLTGAGGGAATLIASGATGKENESETESKRSALEIGKSAKSDKKRAQTKRGGTNNGNTRKNANKRSKGADVPDGINPPNSVETE